jgi:hypothetical protein
MPIPLIVAGGAMLAGAAAGAISKAEKNGRANPRHSGSFQETKYYDPEATLYGGSKTGLRDYNANLNARRGVVEARGANTANYGRANAWEQQGLAARAEQGQIANLMHQRATGATPSIAGMQAQNDIRQLQQGAQYQGQQAMAQQGAQAASARGAAGVALAGQTAQNNTANAQGAIGRGTAMATQNISGQAQVNAANERMQAEQAAFGAYSGMRGQDMGAQQTAAGMSQFNATQEQANRDANDRRAMGYEQLEGAANQGAQAAAVANQGQLAGSHAAADAHNARAYQSRDENDKGWAESIFGGIKDGAGVAGNMGSDERMKRPIDLGNVEDWQQPVDMGEVDDDGPSMDSMLDDRQGQYGGGQDTIGRAALDRELASQNERDRQDLEVERAAPQYRRNDPAVGLERASSERQRRELMGEARRAPAPYGEDEERGVAPGTGDFERVSAEGKKEPWWMTDVSKYLSDEDAKTPIDLGDVEDWGPQKGQDEGYRHRSFQSQMDGELRKADERRAAMKTEERNTPKLFKRDTNGDQKAVKEAFYARLMKDADSKIAGMKDSVKRGASVAIDEGDVDEPKDTRVAANSFTSDDKAKVAAAWDAGHAYAAQDLETLSAAKPEQLKKLAGENRIAKALLAARKGAWDEGAAASKKPKLEVEPRQMASRIDPKAHGDKPRAEEPPVQVQVGGSMFQQGRMVPMRQQGIPKDRETHQPTYPPAPAPAPVGSADPRKGELAMYSDERAKVGLGPERGPVAEANRAMRGEPYAYKPEHTPEHEEPGQPHFGFMAGNLKKSPVSRVAVEKDPKTGLDRVDRDRMLQVVAAGVADLQRQQDELRVGLKKGGKKR